MPSFQYLTPENSYDELLNVDIYYVEDHLHTISNVQDPLALTLAQKEINKKEKFFIFDSYQFLKNYSLYCIYTHDFLLYTVDSYAQEFPNYELNFNKHVAFNCQLNKSRYARVLASCWLANNYNPSDFIYSQPWTITNSMEQFLTDVQLTYNFDLTPNLLPNHWFNYKNNEPNDYLLNTSNAEVFKNCLKEQMFDPCVFSIVMEPIEFEAGCMISEKYVNAVYGGNIPIVYGYNIYNVLESIGFDTFSDIIDISSQDIVDPYQRVIHMFNSNKRVLTNYNNYVNNTSIQDRLNHNLNLLRNNPTLIDGLFKLNRPKNVDTYKRFLNQCIELTNLSENFNHILTQR